MKKEDIKNKLHKLIAEKVFIDSSAGPIISGSGVSEEKWLMDFRKILLRPDVLSDISSLCIQEARLTKETQVCGLEVAAIPLVAGVVVKSHTSGEAVSGFFIRKSRKKTGLLNMIEGEIDEGKDIVLVDDILNSGSSFLRQVKVLESLGKKVRTIFCVVRFRDLSYYTEFTQRGIEIISLFELNDFKNILPVKNLDPLVSMSSLRPYSVEWVFEVQGASLEHVVPKSRPALYEGILFFGTDSGNFYALDVSSQKVLWKYFVPFGSKRKTIFSSPVVYDGKVFFGAYDGNFYALDIKTGSRAWVNFDSDWIGSSPCISQRHNFVFVGVEFGFWKKRGGVAAFDIKTGKKIWQTESPQYTHGSPVYDDVTKSVFCGSNDGVLTSYDAKTGKILWTHKAGGEIKYVPSICPESRHVAYLCFGGELGVLDIQTGEAVYRYEIPHGGYSTPVWIDSSRIITATLDKKIRCFNILEKKLLWEFQGDARIFATPHFYKGHLFCGGNDAILRVLDAHTGKQKALFQATERITNEVVIDEKNNCIYVPTYANQIIKIHPILPS